MLSQKITELISRGVAPACIRGEAPFGNGLKPVTVLVVARSVEADAEFDGVSAMHFGDVIQPFELGLVSKDPRADVTFAPTPRSWIPAKVAPGVTNLRNCIGARSHSIKSKALEIESQRFTAHL